MKVLLVGSGGREHAIAYVLKKSVEKHRLYSVMNRKNPGIARLCQGYLLGNETNTIPIEVDADFIVPYAEEKKIDHAIIGPETPLSEGISDALWAAGIPTVGPKKAAAKIETDKSWARNFMARNKIGGLPEYRVFTKGSNADDYIEELQDVAVKPAGLTGGKGVKLSKYDFSIISQAQDYARRILESGDLVVEELLDGEEFTIQAFTDGETLAFSPAVQDHKRAGDGDTGGNTGGMGSYTDSADTLPFMAQKDYADACEIMDNTVAGLKKQGTPFKGILYGQFMKTAKGINVIEFNARFGDPEAMNVLPILKTDFSKIAKAIIDGGLSDIDVEFSHKATVCKYAVPAGYPDNPAKDSPISIGDIKDALLFYSSVYEKGGTTYTTGSRAVATVGIADDIYTAEKKAESAILQIKGNLEHRRDIGTEPLVQRRVEHTKHWGGRVA